MSTTETSNQPQRITIQKIENDIKGISPRAQLVGGTLSLLCPIDATLVPAAMDYPNNGRNYFINCKTCGHQFLIHKDKARYFAHKSDILTVEDVLGRMA